MSEEEEEETNVITFGNTERIFTRLAALHHVQYHDVWDCGYEKETLTNVRVKFRGVHRRGFDSFIQALTLLLKSNKHIQFHVELTLGDVYQPTDEEIIDALKTKYHPNTNLHFLIPCTCANHVICSKESDRFNNWAIRKKQAIETFYCFILCCRRQREQVLCDVEGVKRIIFSFLFNN